jgi:hypothetical protein
MKKVLIGVVALIALLCLVIAVQPSTFTVERSATMAAPADLVFGYINDFERWQAWSPWEKLDPNMKRDLTGAEAGVGAIYHWSSASDDVGEGRMTITESTPPSKVGIKLEFLKPWEATNTVTFTVDAKEETSTVRWTMNGNHNFMSKAMDLFMGMDSMVGPDFERGLANLKGIVEPEAKKVKEEMAMRKAAEDAAAAAAAAAAAPVQ